MHWRTAVGTLTRERVNEINRINSRHLIELAMAAGVRECVGALQKEH